MCLLRNYARGLMIKRTNSTKSSMQSLISLLHAKFYQATLQAFPELSSHGFSVPIEVTPSTQEKFGHYQCNTAMKLTKELKKPLVKLPSKLLPRSTVRRALSPLLRLLALALLISPLIPPFYPKKLTCCYAIPI